MSNKMEEKEISQVDKVLSTLINTGGWVCGVSFQQKFIPTYSQRIRDLRKKGWDIESDRCSLGHHSHKGQVAMYRIHDHNGWKNYETWNVALWINNEESLYKLAKRSLNYNNFIFRLANASHSELQKFKTGTPDGVKWNDEKVNIEDLDELIKELNQ